LIHTPPVVTAALIAAAFTHRASVGLPALAAACTLTEPAVTFGCAALEPPLMPSSTEPSAEFKVALPLPASTEPMSKLPWLPMTTGPAPEVTELNVTGVVAASLIHTPPVVAAALIVAAFTHRASLALPALAAA